MQTNAQIAALMNEVPLQQLAAMITRKSDERWPTDLLSFIKELRNDEKKALKTNQWIPLDSLEGNRLNMKIVHDALKNNATLKKYVPAVEEKGATAYSCDVLNSVSNGRLSDALVELEKIKGDIAEKRKAKD